MGRAGEIEMPFSGRVSKAWGAAWDWQTIRWGLWQGFGAAFLAPVFLKEDQAVEELTAIFLAILGGFFLAPVMEFAWTFVRAPIREAQAKIHDLELENQRLRPLNVDRITHDVWVLDAIKYIIRRDWSGEVWDISVGAELNALGKAEEDLLQAALDGDVAIWGSVGFESLVRPIRPEYWLEYRFDYFSIIKDDPEQVRTQRSGGGGLEIYVGLKTSKAQVKNIWPKANT
jgi:hypothetical protein